MPLFAGAAWQYKTASKRRELAMMVKVRKYRDGRVISPTSLPMSFLH